MTVTQSFPQKSRDLIGLVPALSQYQYQRSLLSFRSDISMRNHSFLVLFLLLVVGVFGVDTDGVKSVSVMQGDSVTLHTDLTEIPTDGDLRWKTQDDAIIARIDRESNRISVPGNTSFEGRLKLDETTGSLTITNIKTTDKRVYELLISGTNWDKPNKEFSVSVDDVFSVDGVKKMSARKGEPVTLHTEITDIPKDDVIEWTFQDTALAKSDRQAKKSLTYNKEDLTFKDRLQLNTESGDLRINNFKPEMSGLYKVKITKSTYTLQKTFSVTLDDSREFSGSTGTGVPVICGASVVLACAVAVFFLQEV
ncbi:uncharacterized protein LOC127500035 [Ctenopharyngodon idella]|uniref:uncharacterized protein LOC127500035 n=1 Tax=Ctenopharyngodon idella TaxID=7959 RepID=UPI002230F9A2|nr:uncharacterized protein LOC127500035 [Ctenopharyngodon idella]